MYADPPATPSVPDRRVAQARFLRGLASASQVVVMGALFVMWKEFHWNFWAAAERCVVVGVAAYTLFAAAAAVLMALARLEPVALLVGHATRLVSVAIFATLRYVHRAHFIKSVVILAALYVVATVLVRRIERRARRKFGI